MSLQSPPAELEEEGDESYFVSMTDLMVGMLFIFVIMLMAFVLNLREAQQATTEAVEASQSSESTQARILDDVRGYLARTGVQVEIDAEHGVLRLPEEILFSSGSADVSPAGAANLALLAEAMRHVLPCYAVTPTSPLGAPRPPQCQADLQGRLEAVLIEGHTDSDPVGPGAWYRSNLGLSAFRAIATFDKVLAADPQLDAYQNDKGQPLFGVAGYGERRRRQMVERSDADKRLNRRIDLRFLMATPRPEDLDQIEREAQRRIHGQSPASR